MERVPQEIIIYHIVRYLDQEEIVNGLSEVNKYLCGLMRREYCVIVEAYPFEELQAPPEWRNIEGVRCRSTVWGKKKIKCAQFMGRLEKDENGCFTLENLKNQWGKRPYLNWYSFLQYDIQRLQTLPLKILKLEEIDLEQPDFEVIESITTLETLSFDGCNSRVWLDVFPPNLKTLRVSNKNSRKIKTSIKNLPKSLISIDVGEISVPEEDKHRAILPPGLLHLSFSEISPKSPSLPFDIPPSLMILKINRNWTIETLSQLNNLEHLELRGCSDLMSIPFLPQSLQKLVLVSCSRIETIIFPPNIVELEFTFCNKLEIDLPQRLKKLKINHCSQMNPTKFISLPSHLEELDLGGFNQIRTLPELPKWLQSLTLRNCFYLKTLPRLPESLQNLELARLEHLNDIPILSKTLKSLPFWDCNELKQILPNLKELTIVRLQAVNLLNPNLSYTITKLVANGNSYRWSHLTQFPKCLEHLELRNISGTDSLPPFPETLKTLKLDNIKDLKSLPLLPESLKEFDLCECKLIRELPNLPSGLICLKITSCDQIECLGIENGSSSGATGSAGRLPDSLKIIRLWHCKNLQAIGVLPAKLKSLSLYHMNEKLLFHSVPPVHLEEIEINSDEVNR